MNVRLLSKTASAFDISTSITEQGNEHRVLMGWYTDKAPLQELAKEAEGWGMPAAMIQQWLAAAKDSEGIGITVNKNMSSLRLYTHSRDKLAPNESGEIVFQGFKSLPDASVRIDEYRNYGDLREADNLAYARANCQHLQWLDRINELALEDVPLMFSRISNSGRQSWLVTVRHAQLDAGDIIGQQYQGKKLLHLAGGIDATKGAFDTFYLASNPHEVVRFIKY